MKSKLDRQYVLPDYKKYSKYERRRINETASFVHLNLTYEALDPDTVAKARQAIAAQPDAEVLARVLGI